MEKYLNRKGKEKRKNNYKKNRFQNIRISFRFKIRKKKHEKFKE